MTLLVSPLEAFVGGGPLLTLAGTAVDLSSVQDPLTGGVSALWTDTSSGGVVAPAAQGGYGFDALTGLAQLTSVETAAVLDVEIELREPGGAVGEPQLGLETASHTIRLSATVLVVDGFEVTVFGPQPPAVAGRTVLRLLKSPEGGLVAFVNGARVAAFDWTQEAAQIVLENLAGLSVVARYLRRPVVVVGGALATEVDVRGAARCLVNSPPRPVAGPELGEVTAYRAAGASESTGGVLVYTAPEQISLGALQLPGGA